ncbi:putative two component system histidine kinase [Nostocoides australiense Ben110]|uniref:Putative two component system histidine kinase n=1 Tax=Nostocoides australiense Ben110 TaxID=1193182 RepID=W6JVT2_9MICO|nr:sensor histidine kinase [Tetrasphaera australiensis]CCH73613.1 putative two component system histidine kinase [Tetrasphaera australiensis Ben110]
MTTTATPPPTGPLRSLTRLQHVLFAALVVVGTVQAWRTGTSRLPLLIAVVALGGWYAAGARLSGHPRARVGGGRRQTARWWLLLLALVWAAALIAPALVWVAFALWMLAGHVLSLRWAIVFSVAVLLAVVLIPPLSGAPWTIAGVVGPSVGALFALGLSRGQVLLARDALERSRLLQSLVAAQEESTALQTQLLQVQREAGALAERSRLSRDIHDTLAQGFSSIVLLARGSVGVSGEGELREVMRRIERAAGDNLAESRRIVAALAPESLSDSGLSVALRRVLADLEEAGITGRLRVERDHPRLPEEVEVGLLRTAQGALANVRAHSGARTVVATLSGSTAEVRLDIVDDGVGFDPTRVDASTRDAVRGGYGLAGMRARLRELGGDLDIESARGQGCAISAHVPIAAAAQVPDTGIRPDEASGVGS